jgi:hypothetical protein
MNERIKQLALQAGIQDNPDQEGLDLFAELIVKECADACLSVTEPGSSVHLVSVAYANAVKKHFGIKE